MKILLVGDVFGKPGRRAVTTLVPKLLNEEKIDFVVVNGENMAGGKGLTIETCNEMFNVGVDVITTGNHVRDQKEIDEMLKSDDRLVRPYNYPDSMPGKGLTVRTARNGRDVAVLNVIGSVHMKDVVSPFPTVMKKIEEAKKLAQIVLVDMHAEATSEKRAMGWYLNGQVAAVVGTHSHVPTADEEILPGGTAYITDLGMTGPYESVIGLRIDLAFDRFFKGDKRKFEPAKNDARFCGAIVEVDAETGKATSIRPIREKLPNVVS